jgi:large subunit ribosomal protein L3
MTQAWDEKNRLVPITVVEAGENIVTQIKTLDKDGYLAIQVAFGAVDPKRVNKPESGHFSKAGTTPRRYVAEIRTADAETYQVGQALGVDLLEVGSRIDVVGTSKGKGFAGVMKRHGFAGVGASHGAHRNHRKPGSIGATTTPGRVFKGLRMAGRMGRDRVTTLNLTLHGVDLERGLLLVRGAVPGPKGSLVFVRSAVKEA